VKIALDTNVLVSAVAARGLCAELSNLVVAEHQQVVGETVLAEVRQMLKQKMRVPDEVIDEFEALLRTEALIVPRAKVVKIEVRDKSDMPVLAEAISGKAEVLVTGDKDFHEIAAALPIEVLTLRGLWERLQVPFGKH
jgi:uncharacterized protein